jgi:hypothetical protein
VSLTAVEVVDDELEDVVELLEVDELEEDEVAGVVLLLVVDEVDEVGVAVEVVWVEEEEDDCPGGCKDSEYATATAAMTMTRTRTTTKIVLLTPDLSLEEYTGTRARGEFLLKFCGSGSWP